VKPIHPTAIPVPVGDARVVLVVVSERHRGAVAAIHRVHAASLRVQALSPREGAEKQETPGVDAPEVSTAPDLCTQNRRAARAQSDTRL
jgi:hypothetical protein